MMRRHEPCLKLQRLVVTSGGDRVYDQLFHSGVNIIRGTNGSGKSTIINFINFVLGGESGILTEAASSCDMVFAEIEVNGKLLTLRREIEVKQRRPLALYWGDFGTASKKSVEGWELYPYQATKNKDSFSQVMFRAMDLPEVRADLEWTTGRITMHQVLRLIYVDQMSSTLDIFRTEQFDSGSIRDAIGRLLCGVYDDHLYELRLRWRELDQERRSLSKQIDYVTSILGDVEQIPELHELEKAIRQRQLARKEKYRGLEELRSQKSAKPTEGPKKFKQVSSLQDQLHKMNRQIEEVLTEKNNIILEIEDSSLFLEYLKVNIRSVEESVETRQALGGIPFAMCPLCYCDIAEPSDAGVCPLCKEKLTQDGSLTGVLRMKQELAFQSRESKQLQEERSARLQTLKARLSALTTKQAGLQLELEKFRSPLTSEYESALGELEREIGYLDREIEDLGREARLASAINKLKERKAYIQYDLSMMTDEIRAIESEMASRQRDAYDEIGKATLDFLRQDLEREKELREAIAVEFDFDKDRVTADGRANFGASSLVILRNSFHLGLLVASTRKEYFRYPRLAILDDIEDKGMEEVRSRNFQRVIVETSKALDVEHQIIFSTSMIDPELEKTDLTVGDFYTQESKSLRFVKGLR